MADEILRIGQRVRVKADAQFTRYAGKEGTITDAFSDLEGKPQYGVLFDDGIGIASLYQPEELERAEEASDGG